MFPARKRIFITLFILTVLVLMLPVAASAAEFDASLQLQPGKVEAIGDEIQITVNVENISCGTEDPVSLCDASGEPVPDFGEGGYALLPIGAKASASFSYGVKPEDVSAGQVVFVLKYTKVVDDDVQHFEQKLTAPITFNGTVVSLSAQRSITPEVARKGSTVSVVYELYNNGTVEITDIKLQETVVKTAQTVKSLQPGQKTTLTFSPRMGTENLTSSAVIQYKANGEAGEQSIPAAEIPLATPNLTMSASCEQDGVNIGETAEIQVIFDNKGNITYHNVSVSDEKAGTLLTGLDIPANRTVSYTVPVVMTEPVTFRLKADLNDNTGSTASISADPLSVNAYDPEKSIRLSLVLTADDDTVTEVPATVAFRLVITNDSNVTAKNIRVTHREQSIVSNITLEPGQSQTLIRNVRISSPGSFRFTASCQDALGNNVSYDSNTLKITKVTVVSTPAPTMIPLPVQPTAVPAEDTLSTLSQTQVILFNAAIYLGAATAVIALLVLIALAVRLIRKIIRKGAYDHMELSDRRDYRQAASGSGDRKPVEPSVVTEEAGRDLAKENEVDLNDDSLTVGAAEERDNNFFTRTSVKKQEPETKPAEKAEPAPIKKPTVSTRPVTINKVPEAKSAGKASAGAPAVNGGRHAVTGGTADDGE